MEIKPQDLVITTFNTSGSSWVTNDGGVRIYHKPTGIDVYSSTEKTQHLNRNKCLATLEEELCYYKEDNKSYITNLCNSDGGVEVRMINGKCYWSLEGCRSMVEEEIPLSLYMEIKKHVTNK